MGIHKKWGEEYIEYLKEIASGKSHKEITELMNNKFEYQFNVRQIRNLMYRNRILSETPRGIKPEPSNTIAIHKNNRARIKTEDGKWEYKHRHIYEKHYGKIKKGNYIIFLDGDTTNFNIDNLAEVTKKQLLYINKNNLKYNNAELSKAGIELTNLMIKIDETKKKNKGGYNNAST